LTQANLDLAPIGNCAASALVDRAGRIVWACAPRVDGDPLFSALLSGADLAGPELLGVWSFEVEELASVEQTYLRNTAVLSTRYTDANGAVLEVLTFCPSPRGQGRVYRPLAYVRLVRPLKGAPRVRIRLRPAADWGARAAERTSGSNHVRYLCGPVNLRLSTNAPVGHVLSERPFRVERELAFFLGPDEPFSGDVLGTVRTMFEDTVTDWREWVRTLAVPLDYQDVVIRAAIALKLCVHEETGAIVAALTTSIPEAAESGRNWDYRYCWIRDAYYVVQALNRLGASTSWRATSATCATSSTPPAAVTSSPSTASAARLGSASVSWIACPVIVAWARSAPGNQAHEHLQHDVYGQIVLSNVQAFFDERLLRPADARTSATSSRSAKRAFAGPRHADAGLWEFRTIARDPHLLRRDVLGRCDRLANARRAGSGLIDPAAGWRSRADAIRERVETSAWRPALDRYAASFEGDELDASLLQLVEVRFLTPDDPRFAPPSPRWRPSSAGAPT
jgi:GH15 family glucan-1,4-alpha-glucosidase